MANGSSSSDKEMVEAVGRSPTGHEPGRGKPQHFHLLESIDVAFKKLSLTGKDEALIRILEVIIEVRARHIMNLNTVIEDDSKVPIPGLGREEQLVINGWLPIHYSLESFPQEGKKEATDRILEVLADVEAHFRKKSVIPAAEMSIAGPSTNDADADTEISMANRENVKAIVAASAPAKIILFGEHSVVYGYPAIAASIDKRTTVQLELNNSKIFALRGDTLGLDLSWELPIPNDLAVDESFPIQKRQAIECIHSIYRSVVGDLNGNGINLKITSDFPCGAGLGSSASFAAALGAAFSAAVEVVRGKVKSEGTLILDDDFLRDVKNTAHESEKAFHGNPSGIDTTVSVYGGIVRFQKGSSTTIEKIADSFPLKVGIVDSGIQRDTKKLVNQVKELKDNPNLNRPLSLILEAMGALADEATKQIRSHSSGLLLNLAKMNHGLLCSLDVSHSTLDTMNLAVADLDVAFKITGAGGGGYGIIFLSPDASESAVKTSLKKYGFDVDFVQVGVSGVQVDILKLQL